MKRLTAAVSAGAAEAADEGSSRREFLAGGAGAAAGAAMILGAPKVASILDTPGKGEVVEPKGVATKPSGPAPREPVTAYVRDEGRGEVTVMSGIRETTYTDPALVTRLLDAAK
jgi:hypothetical protein